MGGNQEQEVMLCWLRCKWVNGWVGGGGACGWRGKERGFGNRAQAEARSHHGGMRRCTDDHRMAGAR